MSSSPATAPPPDSSSAASPPPATSTPSPPPPDSSASPPPESPSPPPPSSSPPPPSESPPPPLQVPTTPSGPSTGSNSPPEPQLDLPIVPPSTTFSSPQPETGVTKPPSTPSKPTHSKSGDHAKSNDGKSSDVSLPTVIGVSIGVGLFVVLMLVSVIICTRKKRKPRRPMHYYDAPGFKGGFYTSGSLPKWQNGGNDIEHNGNLPPPPGAYIPKEEGRNAQPGAPFPQAMFSSEMSSDHSSPRNNASSLPPYSPSPLALGFNKSTFAFEELSAATSGFSENNLLGQGGFGYVFKGVLPNGKEIAVKQLKAGSGQGEREFQAEIEIISRVHHRHLVSLVGYCIAGPQRLLVYEFVPNRTLEYHLRGNDGSVMDWPIRLKIAIGSAKGLAYLHEDCHPRIIHRDIKSANILLDYKFDAKVADFGLAKLSEDTKTHVSTRIMGTFGYLAPEYASTGKLTEKSDVFSFGVLLLELITGRPAIDRTQTFMEDSLVDWAAPLMNKALTEDNYQELIDPRLMNSYDNSEVARMVASAAACVRHSARRRPKMSKIIRALEGDLALEDLNEGMKPGQSMLVSSSSDLDADSYTTNLRQFKRVALGSNDDFTEGYSGATTSEYGHNTSDSSSSGEMHDSTSNRNKNLYLGM